MKKEQIELEYAIKASIKSLYSKISTPEGLADWFADTVHFDLAKQEYEFCWDGETQKARVTAQKSPNFIRFDWEDEGDGYIEFRIDIDSITQDMALVITDFVEPDEGDDAAQLWNLQIESLKKSLGAN
ncbi:MAG: SRPBCC domain-containing protein [Bacteroidales bacterium]|jgi:uncharacterized protein YndB with AHSA1/START domain|nr:SRPBCC domain-containing protein [Bacteroidales bacterium]